MVNFSIELGAGFESYFKKEIEKEVSLRLKSSINAITESIEIALQTLVKARLHEAPEVDSLASGELRYQFGLVDGASRISNIIDMWAESVEVRYVSGFGKLGGISISMGDNDYSKALSMPEAEFTTEEGTPLEWLRWLLLEGDTRIVNNYRFQSGKRGRAGGGIMVSRQNSSWGVPSQFAGTDSNNFATRALESMQDEIDVIVRREITKVV
jgi:hypothetical protein|tara:strand:+ start:36 stop:668 length:633 start_codon:yes stop_codon:yes gene_type:complete